VREKVLKYVREELPFVTAVYIESIEKKGQPVMDSAREGTVPLDREDRQPGETRPVTYIRASIFVEKDSHRKIVIGRHASLIKQVGIEARREIEDYVGQKVYLDLQVRVREGWRDSEDVLDLIEGQKG
jgi:GTP-binding protein Era